MNVPDAIPFNPYLDTATGTTTNDILWNLFREHPKTGGEPRVDRVVLNVQTQFFDLSALNATYNLRQKSLQLAD